MKNKKSLKFINAEPLWRLRFWIAIALFILAGILWLFFALTNLPTSSKEAEEMASSGTSQTVDIRFDRPQSLNDWHEHVFNKKSRYKIEPDEQGETALHASSRDTFSFIFKIIKVPVRSHPILSWEWRAVKFPTGKKYQGLGAVGENDFAIRVCAVFAKNNPFATKIVQYVWDDHYPIGTHDKSPYSDNVRMLVVHSGPPQPKTWALESRDLIKDYELVFGEPPSGSLRAISIVSNSDDTHTESEAYVRRIWINKSVMEPGAHKWKRHFLLRTKRLEHRLKEFLDRFSFYGLLNRRVTN